MTYPEAAWERAMTVQEGAAAWSSVISRSSIVDSGGVACRVGANRLSEMSCASSGFPFPGKIVRIRPTLLAGRPRSHVQAVETLHEIEPGHLKCPPDLSICALPACSAPRIIEAPRRALGRIRFTPDGRGLAFKDPTNVNLMVQPFDGRAAYPLTRFSSGDVFDFAWSADGARLAIVRATTTNDIVLFRGLR